MRDKTGSQGTSTVLFWRARAGDAAALNQLFERYLPWLRRLTHGRVPRWARGIADTADLIQHTVLQAFTHLDHFEPRRRGALRAYLRRIVENQIRDQYRRAVVRREHHGEDALEVIEDPAPKPLDVAIGSELRARYIQALSRLSRDHRRAVVARVELGYSYEQISLMLNRSSVEAARMTVARALARLATEMEKLAQASTDEPARP